ncbi:MAG: VOC family protein [Bacteroidia bacterium]
MARINPYLTFNGNCEQAFIFYLSVFGGKFKDFSRFGEFSPIKGQELPESDLNKIMHVSLPISKETILMGSDALPIHGAITIGQNLSLSVDTDTKEEADKIFNQLAKGGKITMPIATTFWGAYFGMLIDPFGIIWMVNYDEKK